MRFLIGLALTPLASLAGTVIVMAGLDLVLGPAFTISDAADLVWVGLLIGCVLAAPVTLGVLPAVIARYAEGPRSNRLYVILWGLGSGFLSIWIVLGPFMGSSIDRLGPLLVLLSIAGAIAGGLCAELMLRLSSRSATRTTLLATSDGEH